MFTTQPTSHQLARLILAQRDLPVTVDGVGCDTEFVQLGIGTGVDLNRVLVIELTITEERLIPR